MGRKGGGRENRGGVSPIRDGLGPKFVFSNFITRCTNMVDAHQIWISIRDGLGPKFSIISIICMGQNGQKTGCSCKRW